MEKASGDAALRKENIYITKLPNNNLNIALTKSGSTRDIPSLCSMLVLNISSLHADAGENDFPYTSLYSIFLYIHVRYMEVSPFQPDLTEQACAHRRSSAVHFQGSHGGHDDDGAGREAGRTALDVHELLHAIVGAEAALGYCAKEMGAVSTPSSKSCRDIDGTAERMHIDKFHHHHSQCYQQPMSIV